MKTCPKCGETKELDEFHRDRSRRDKHNNRCKVCVLAYAKETGYAASNRYDNSEWGRAYRRRWQRENK